MFLEPHVGDHAGVSDSPWKKTRLAVRGMSPASSSETGSAPVTAARAANQCRRLTSVHRAGTGAMTFTPLGRAGRPLLTSATPAMIPLAAPCLPGERRGRPAFPPQQETEGSGKGLGVVAIARTRDAGRRNCPAPIVPSSVILESGAAAVRRGRAPAHRFDPPPEEPPMPAVSSALDAPRLTRPRPSSNGDNGDEPRAAVLALLPSPVRMGGAWEPGRRAPNPRRHPR